MSLQDMALHEEYQQSGRNILRVPGGWLYQMWDWHNECWLAPVFVPFQREFQDEELS